MTRHRGGGLNGESGDERREKWVSVRTAPDQLTAELWRELLVGEGIPATLAPGDAVSFLGVTTAPVRVLVPASARERAELVLDGEAWSRAVEEG